MDSDELGTPPTPPRLTRGVPHTPEPPSPPRLTRSEGVGFTGRMQRRPSQRVEGDEWIERFTLNASPVIPRELFDSPRSSGSWTDTTEEDINVPTWWFEMPEKFRSDVFWNHMFGQSEFFLLGKKIRPEKREAIDTIMGLLDLLINNKGIYDTRSRTHTLKNPFPKVVNVAFVKHFLMNLTPLSLTPEDSYRFKMMIMNFLMFAPMSALLGYIDRLTPLTRRGGKTKKRRKYKTKRV
jgi:hypothetical protein